MLDWLFSTGNPYRKIDRGALRTPRRHKKNVEHLAAYLGSLASNPSGKTRAIFRWITHHIRYDSQALTSGNYGDLSPAGVLQRRKAVCAGYANLFEALGRAMRLNVATIRGYSKGLGYTVGSRFNGQSNHAWNAVQINGKWHLLDCTWGAGHVTEPGGYVREFNEHYFLTPPKEFIYDHFPENSNWQFLDRIISLHEYEDWVHVRSPFFQHQLAFLSHQNHTIQANKQVVISLIAPSNVWLLSSLIQGKNERSPIQPTIQSVGSRRDIHVSLPQSGDYFLSVFAKKGNAFGTYQGVLEYKIHAVNTDDANGSKSGTRPILRNSASRVRNKAVEKPWWVFRR